MPTLADYEIVLLNFAATLAGVFLAFVLGLRHERKKRRSDEREKQYQMLTSFKQELQTNQGILGDMSKGGAYRGAQMFLWTNAYQSVVSGGDLILLNPKLQTKLEMVYLQFKQLERYGQKLIDAYGVTGMEHTINDFIT